MNDFSPEDERHLNAACGALRVNDMHSAGHELAYIRPELRRSVPVLAVCWHLECADGNWARCVEISRALTSAAPEVSLHWVGLGTALLRMGLPEEAYRVLSRVVTRLPGDIPIRETLVEVCKVLGKRQEAQTWLWRVAELRVPS